MSKASPLSTTGSSLAYSLDKSTSIARGLEAFNCSEHRHKWKCSVHHSVSHRPVVSVLPADVKARSDLLACSHILTRTKEFADRSDRSVNC